MIDLATLVLVHRYLYYVLSRPVISDYEYDMMERSLDPDDPVRNSVGSDQAKDYSFEVRALAQSLLDGNT